MKVRMERGFTIVELMVAVGLSVVIMGLVSYSYNNTSKAVSRSLELISEGELVSWIIRNIQEDAQQFNATCQFDMVPDPDPYGGAVEKDYLAWMGFVKNTEISPTAGQATTSDHISSVVWIKYKYHRTMQTLFRVVSSPDQQHVNVIAGIPTRTGTEAYGEGSGGWMDTKLPDIANGDNWSQYRLMTGIDDWVMDGFTMADLNRSVLPKFFDPLTDPGRPGCFLDGRGGLRDAFDRLTYIRINFSFTGSEDYYTVMVFMPGGLM